MYLSDGDHIKKRVTAQHNVTTANSMAIQIKIVQSHCAKCGLKHQTSNCMKDQQPEASFIPKCCLCAGDHRLNYINMKLNQSKASSMRPLNGQSRHRSSPSPRASANLNSSWAPVTANKKILGLVQTIKSKRSQRSTFRWTAFQRPSHRNDDRTVPGFTCKQDKVGSNSNRCHRGT